MRRSNRVEIDCTGKTREEVAEQIYNIIMSQEHLTYIRATTDPKEIVYETVQVFPE